MEIRKKQGRPSQGKVNRPHTLDAEVAAFIDSLPDGDRSRFVNRIIKQELELEVLSGKFYVYVLMRPDGSIFYVGKGQRNRINEHEIEARREEAQSDKVKVIREVWAEGKEILKQKIAFFDVEQDAYDLETCLIKFFGMENLTNLVEVRGAAIGNRNAVLYNRDSLQMRVNGGLVELIDDYLLAMGNGAPDNQDRREVVEEAIRKMCTRITEDQKAIIV
jgi:hypothetical protein